MAAGGAGYASDAGWQTTRNLEDHADHEANRLTVRSCAGPSGTRRAGVRQPQGLGIDHEWISSPIPSSPFLPQDMDRTWNLGYLMTMGAMHGAQEPFHCLHAYMLCVRNP